MGGYTMEELLSLGVCDICPDLTPEALRRATSRRSPTDRCRASSPGPSARTARSFPAEVSSARLDVDGEIYMFGVARDVSERKAAESARKALAAAAAADHRGRAATRRPRAPRRRRPGARDRRHPARHARARAGSGAGEPPSPRSRRRARRSARSPSRWRGSCASTIRPSSSASVSPTRCARTCVSSPSGTASAGASPRCRVEGLANARAGAAHLSRRAGGARQYRAPRARGATRSTSAIDAIRADHLVRFGSMTTATASIPTRAAERHRPRDDARARHAAARHARPSTSAPADGTTVELLVPLAPEPPVRTGASSGRSAMRFVRSPLAPERPRLAAARARPRGVPADGRHGERGVRARRSATGASST